MADRDWDYGGYRGREPGRRREERRGPRWAGGERRSFDERGRFNSDEDRYGPGARAWRYEPQEEGGEPWRGEARYGARYDQDRAGYGGQEYGQEGGRAHRADRERDPYAGRDERETWRPDRGEPYGDLELNPRNRGVQEYGPPADYAYHPPAGHELDPEYLTWRDQQLRGHDRDYQEWRRSQQQQYDEDYRRFRAERRDTFGRSFQAWRSQRSMVGGAPAVTVQPGAGGPSGGSGGYGDDAATPGGYTGRNAGKPSGMLEPFTAMNASPAAAQTGGETTIDTEARPSRADASPEFGKEPPQVQAASEGHGREAPGEPQADAARDETKP
jgi:hypothetical protein